ncbi:hypothetical protein ACQKWADRAFT_64473 [Trichoderma austrokoningii]
MCGVNKATTHAAHTKPQSLNLTSPRLICILLKILVKFSPWRIRKMVARKRDKLRNQAKSLLNWHSRASSPALRERLPASSAIASASLPSAVYLESSRISSKQRSSFSSATPSQPSSVVAPAANTPLLFETDPESSKTHQVYQIPAKHSPQVSPSSKSSSESLVAPEFQPIQCSLDLAPPSMPIVVTAPEAQVVSDTPQSTPPRLLDLWSRAIDEAKSESGTLKWLQKHEIVSMDGTQQINKKAPNENRGIEELISLIEANRLSEQSDKPLRIPIGNREVIIRDYITNTIAFITKVGGATFALAPTDASAPWAVAKAVLQIPVHQVEQKAALLGTVKWFTSIVRRGQIYETLYTAETTDKKALEGLRDGLLQVYIAAIKMLAKSDNFFNSRTARQTLTAILEPSYASDAIKDLVEKEEKLDREVYACEVSRSVVSSTLMSTQIRDLEKQLCRLSSPLPQIEKGVVSLLAKLEEEKLKSLLEFISPEMFGKSHASVAEKRINDTGGWLLASEGFQAWQEASLSTLLCLQGTVGTGKTYLTSKAIDHIKQKLESSPQHNEGFAFFYCNRSGPSMQDPLIVLKSFIRQLAGKAFDTSGIIQYSLVQRCETIQREKRDFTYKDCENLILESFNLFSRTTIILDALDETDVTNYNLGAILTTLMQKSENPIKIFISSRPDREYLDAFADDTIITVDASNQQEDIERFLTEKLYNTNFFKQRRPAIQNEIRDVFATRSCGMFRWVYLQVMSLKKRTTDEAIHNWACNLPVDLMTAYDELWNSIKEHDENDAALAERAIMWILCSFMPFKTEVLLQAVRHVMQGSKLLRSEEQTRQQILSLCQDFLTIDKESGEWMLPHASVAEYFEKRGVMSLWECDLFASKLCLNVLDDHLHGDLDGHLNDHRFQLYVGRHWYKHVQRYEQWLGSREQETEREPDPYLSAALKQFLGSPDKSSANFRRWNDWRAGFDPLFIMCSYGFYYTLRDWWEQPGKITAEVALKRENGSDALRLAAEVHSMPICRHLVNLIEAVHPKGDNYWAYVLGASIGANNFDMVDFFLTEMKADVNSTGRSNNKANAYVYTGAQTAAMRQPKILQWLVDKGAVDLERENDGGCRCGNVLIAAVSQPNVESVRILLKAGANANAVVQSGSYGSALVAAAAIPMLFGKVGTEIVQLLLDHGADPTVPLRGGDWGSALEASVVEQGFKWLGDAVINKTQILLLEAGTDPTVISKYGKYGSALAAVAFWGQKESLKAMIDKVGKERAIETFRQSRHPDRRVFMKQQAIARWKGTATYLAEEVGVSKEILRTIGFWDVEPKPEPALLNAFVLRYR